MGCNCDKFIVIQSIHLVSVRVRGDYDDVVLPAAFSHWGDVRQYFRQYGYKPSTLLRSTECASDHRARWSDKYDFSFEKYSQYSLFFLVIPFTIILQRNSTNQRALHEFEKEAYIL